MVNRFYLERRTVDKKIRICSDMAKHLLPRSQAGNTLIIADRPFAIKSALRKKWLYIYRRMVVQRASTLDEEKINAYLHVVLHMHRTSFLTYVNTEKNSVSILLPDEVCACTMRFTTIYVCCKLPDNCLDHLKNLTNKSSVVVDYANTVKADG